MAEHEEVPLDVASRGGILTNTCIGTCTGIDTCLPSSQFLLRSTIQQIYSLQAQQFFNIGYSMCTVCAYRYFVQTTPYSTRIAFDSTVRSTLHKLSVTALAVDATEVVSSYEPIF